MSNINRMKPQVYALALLALPLAVAQEKPQAGEIVDRVTKAYAGATQFHLAGEVQGTTTPKRGGDTSKTAHSFLIALQLPNKVHLEVTPDPGMETMYVISNGKAAWAYSPTRNEYMTAEIGR